MPRYIDAEQIQFHYLPIPAIGDVYALKYQVDKIPTADVAEVKHGKWDCEKHIILNTTTIYIKWKCSNCGVVAKKGLSYDDINNHAPSYLYCPECGAKMDGENNVDKD